MELTLIACRFAGKPGNGLWDLVYQAEMPSGATGKITRHYKFDDRDVVSDEYYASPNISEEVRKCLADCEDNMDIWDYYFCWAEEGKEDSEAYGAAAKECTDLIASW